MATTSWNSEDAIKSAIAQYKVQYDQAIAAIGNLDQQRAQLVKTTDTLVGAVAALEQLLTNQRDEAAALAALDKAAGSKDSTDAEQESLTQG